MKRVFFVHAICSVNILLAFSRDGNIAEYSGCVVIDTNSAYLKIKFTLIRWRTGRMQCNKSTCVMKVLPRDVALEAMVLTCSLHGVSQRDAGKEPRQDRYMSLILSGLLKAHCWKPSQGACLFRGYLRVNHRTSVLSTVLPLFASRV